MVAALYLIGVFAFVNKTKIGRIFSKFMKKNIFFAISIILCLSIGFLLGRFSINQNTIKDTMRQEIEKRLINGKVINPIPEKVYELKNVKVLSIENDSILVNHPDGQDPLMNIFPYESLKIIVDANTTIGRLNVKSPIQYEQERQAFTAAENKENLVQPSPFSIEKSQLTDIQSGYYINLVKVEENIKGKGSFLAQEIQFSVQSPLGK
jgi:hypothetical protein